MMTLEICGTVMRKFAGLALAVGFCGLISGCQDLNLAIDGILGQSPPAIASVARTHVGSPLVIAKKREPGAEAPQPAATKPAVTPPAPEKPAPPTKAEPEATPAPPGKAPEKPPVAMQGKRRAPGAPAPEKPAVAVPAPPVKSVFTVERDPFKQPTEILPTECPPSLPLCRFDRSQLKLVGVIQVGEGELRGMVEDPDGRGYFVGTGMQIGGATITQVTAKGMVLHDHRTRQDIAMPLFREAREGMEF